ncbi:AraC family transcriptional regulator [bacterium]|nr:MAG: AraC family transcriptional regulator [bacterium]
MVERRLGYEYTAQGNLLAVLVRIERLNLQAKDTGRPEMAATISRAIAFMERHLAEPINLGDMARTARLNETYFCEAFKQATGISPGRYLMRLRLEHGRYLLLSTTEPITYVARQSGFADPSHFARAFKAAFNTSPSRLRRTQESS